MKDCTRLAVVMMFVVSVSLYAVNGREEQAAKKASKNEEAAPRQTGGTKPLGSVADEFPEDLELHRKIEAAEQMVNDAAEFFNQNTLGNACRSFGKDERWYNGEIDIDMFDADGNCYLYGSELLDLWTNFKEVEKVQETRGISSRPLGIGVIEDMVAKGDKGGGWVSFEWNFAINYSYVRTVVKEGVKYIISSGIYPESPRFQIQQLAKSAIRYAQRKGAAAAFQQINNPSGEFVLGDSYLWAYNMKGECFAHAHNPALIGQSMINFQDTPGHYRNKDMIALVNKQGSGWIDYEESGIKKYAYVEGFEDPKTKQHYIIGGGYYPDLTDETIISFVKKATEYLKAQGATVALRDFSSYTGGFIKGPLRIAVYSPDGLVLADANNPIFIGQNLMNARDAEGKEYIRDLIQDVSSKGRAWVTYLSDKAYKQDYGEFVETPDGKYIVAAGFWPTSKERSARALSDKAALHLSLTANVEAMHSFTTYNSSFLRGDLFVEVYDDQGICYAYGWDRDHVWNDEKLVLDKKGYPIIDQVINVAQRGGGWAEYEMNKATRRVYAQMVTKPVPVIPIEKGKETKEVAEMKTENGVTRKDVKPEKKTQTFIVGVGYYV